MNVLHHQLEEDQKKSAEAHVTIVTYEDDSDPPQLSIALTPLGGNVDKSSGNSSSHMKRNEMEDPVMLFLDP